MKSQIHCMISENHELESEVSRLNLVEATLRKELAQQIDRYNQQEEDNKRQKKQMQHLNCVKINNMKDDFNKEKQILEQELDLGRQMLR